MKKLIILLVVAAAFLAAGCATSGVQDVRSARERQTRTQVTLEEMRPPADAAVVYLEIDDYAYGSLGRNEREIMRTALRDTLDNYGFSVVVPRRDRQSYRSYRDEDNIPSRVDYIVRIVSPTVIEKGRKDYGSLEYEYVRVLLGVEMYTVQDVLVGTGYGDGLRNIWTGILFGTYKVGGRVNASYEAAMEAASRAVDDLLASLEAKGRAEARYPPSE